MATRRWLALLVALGCLAGTLDASAGDEDPLYSMSSSSSSSSEESDSTETESDETETIPNEFEEITRQRYKERFSERLDNLIKEYLKKEDPEDLWRVIKPNCSNCEVDYKPQPRISLVDNICEFVLDISFDDTTTVKNLLEIFESKLKYFNKNHLLPGEWRRSSMVGLEKTHKLMHNDKTDLLEHPNATLSGLGIKSNDTVFICHKSALTPFTIKIKIKGGPNTSVNEGVEVVLMPGDTPQDVKEKIKIQAGIKSAENCSLCIVSQNFHYPMCKDIAIAVYDFLKRPEEKQERDEKKPPSDDGSYLYTENKMYLCPNDELHKRLTRMCPTFITIPQLSDRNHRQVRLLQPSEEKKALGILLPTTVRSKSQTGEVVAVGEERDIGKNIVEDLPWICLRHDEPINQNQCNPSICDGLGNEGSCVEECVVTGHLGDLYIPDCQLSDNDASLNNSWYVQEPLYLQWKQLNCRSDCRYHCMMQREKERGALGLSPVKYHGKWPFKHVFVFQEPVSAVVSAINLLMHFIGWLSFFLLVNYKLPLRHQGKKTYYEYTGMWHIYGLLSMNAWFWSAIYHIRDFELTEKLDCSSAVAALGYSLILSLFRSFNVKDEASRVMLAAPILAFVTTHILYLNFYQLDYGWNMKVCLVMGIFQLLVWVVWAGGTRHPSRFKLWTVMFGTGIALFLGTYDFPPYEGYVDASALRHAINIPLIYLWWSFIRADAEQRTLNLVKKVKKT